MQNWVKELKKMLGEDIALCIAGVVDLDCFPLASTFKINYNNKLLSFKQETK